MRTAQTNRMMHNVQLRCAVQPLSGAMYNAQSEVHCSMHSYNTRCTTVTVKAAQHNHCSHRALHSHSPCPYTAGEVPCSPQRVAGMGFVALLFRSTGAAQQKERQTSSAGKTVLSSFIEMTTFITSQFL